MSSVRLTLTLYCTTNSTEYARICCDIIKAWETASDLDKALIRRYGFTLQTENEVNVGLDFGHEKFVNIVRDTTGSESKRGNDLRIEHARQCRITHQNEKDINCANERLRPTTTPTGGSVIRKADDVTVYACVTAALEDRGFFSWNSADRLYEPDTDKLYSPLEVGAVLNAAILDTILSGSLTRDKYATTYYIDSVGKVSREKREVDLKGPESSSKKGGERQEKLRVLATSTSSEILRKNGTRVQLISELERLRDYRVLPSKTGLSYVDVVRLGQNCVGAARNVA
jgi:hypothetical protein